MTQQIGSRTAHARRHPDTYRQWAACTSQSELKDLRREMSCRKNTAQRFGPNHGSHKVPVEHHLRHPISNTSPYVLGMKHATNSL